MQKMKQQHLMSLDILGFPMYFDEHGAPIYTLPPHVVKTNDDFELFCLTIREVVCIECGFIFRIQPKSFDECKSIWNLDYAIGGDRTKINADEYGTMPFHRGCECNNPKHGDDFDLGFIGKQQMLKAGIKLLEHWEAYKMNEPTFLLGLYQSRLDDVERDIKREFESLKKRQKQLRNER